MKRSIIFLILIGTPFFPAHCKNICVDADQSDIAIVETYVTDSKDWLQTAWTQKVANRKQQMIREEVDRSISNSEALPAGDDKIIKKAMSRVDYKTRKQRDLEPQK